MIRFKGAIKDFPPEVVHKMCDRQEECGNKRDVSRFEHYSSSGKAMGGFDWGDTAEGFNFWHYVIVMHDWELFFAEFEGEWGQ